MRCSTPGCEEDDVYALLACAHCLSAAFDKHYCLLKATWWGGGAGEGGGGGEGFKRIRRDWVADVVDIGQGLRIF